MRIASIALLLLLQGFDDRVHSVEQRVFDAVNDARRARHVPALRWSARIAEQARQHSTRMSRLNFFSHNDPQLGGPGDRLTRAGIRWRACGENIYQEYNRQDPVQSAVRSWLQSPGHRGNLLSGTYTDTGIGVAISPRGEYTITQMFAAFQDKPDADPR